MLIRLAGASLRAAMVATVVVVPALMLPDVSTSAEELAIIAAALAAAFVIFEYGFQTPSLIEFRFAAPYNRFRFAMFAAVLVALTLAFRPTIHDTGASILLTQMAQSSLAAWDFAGSPVRAFMTLTGAMDDTARTLVATAAALAITVTVATMLVFAAIMTFFSWPLSRDTFNLWINIPTFDANLGEDAQAALRQSAFMSVLIGLTLPYLAPQAALAFMGPLEPVSPGNSLILVWMIAIWCFVPAATLLRAVALYRVAHLLALENVSEG
ncbi:MAG: hypothetical protein AAF761_00240 [Pseudomonadota bacterium]